MSKRAPQKFAWRGTFHARVDPQRAGALVARLCQDTPEDGVPAALVKESEPEDALLHDEFQWDNDVAGALYREQQARHIIGSLVVVEVAKPDAPPTRGFVSVRIPTDDGMDRRYVSTTVALANPDWRRNVLRDALDDLARTKRRYQGLKELARVFQEIDRLEAALTPKLEQAS